MRKQGRVFSPHVPTLVVLATARGGVPVVAPTVLPDVGRVLGTVTDGETGKPVTASLSGQPGITATTAEAGSFLLGKVPVPDTYIVEVTASG